MSEKVSAELVKKTRASLSKVLKKANIPDKLLERPPFHFIYDIVMAIVAESACLNNVYTKLEINNIEAFKLKESKIDFLKKLISSIESGLEIQLDVSPGKIVAGKEPSKTNIMLQKLVLLAQSKPISKNEIVPMKNVTKPNGNLMDVLSEIQSDKAPMIKLLQLIDQLNANIQSMTKEYESLVKEEQTLDKQLSSKQMSNGTADDEIVALKKRIDDNEKLIFGYNEQIKSIKERINNNYDLVKNSMTQY